MVHAIRIATAAVGAVNMARQIRTCPATPVCPVNDGCISIDPTNGATFAVTCAVDFYGKDFLTDQTESYTDCLHACSITQGCVAISFVDNFCYLKNAVPNAVTNTRIQGATLTGIAKATPTPSATAFCPGTAVSCPAYDNCIFPAGAAGLRQKPFVIACNTDFYGGDSSHVVAADMATCLNNCALQGTCVAVSYVAKTKTCYLKSTLTAGHFNPDVVGAFPRPV